MTALQIIDLIRSLLCMHEQQLFLQDLEYELMNCMRDVWNAK